MIASGRVQGVGYRQFIVSKARELDITGWVRNRADGTVEAIVEGDLQAVQAMIEHARRGPPFSEVSSLQIADTPGTFKRFEVLPTV